MRYVFASYVQTNKFENPELWLKHINFYIGILEKLALINEVHSIEQINYEGTLYKNGIDYHFKRYSKKNLKFFPYQLNQYIKRLHPDVVFINGLHFPFQIIQLRLQLGNKIKIIAQNHAELPFTGVKKYLQRFASYYVQAYLFASKPMGLDWVKKGNIKSASKIHEVMEVSSVFYPIDKKLAFIKTGVNGAPIYLWVGRLDKNKNPLLVIDSFLKFLDFQPSARLFMIYSTNELLSEIKERLEKSVHKNSILLIGKVPHDEMLYWLNSVDFIISASYHEGSGTAICEAMSCGCIPIVSDIFSLNMITNNGRSGILYEVGNHNSLLSALKKSLELNMAATQNEVLSYYKSTLSFEAIAGCINSIANSL